MYCGRLAEDPEWDGDVYFEMIRQADGILSGQLVDNLVVSLVGTKGQKPDRTAY